MIRPVSCRSIRLRNRGICHPIRSTAKIIHQYQHSINNSKESDKKRYIYCWAGHNDYSSPLLTSRFSLNLQVKTRTIVTNVNARYDIRTSSGLRNTSHPTNQRLLSKAATTPKPAPAADFFDDEDEDKTIPSNSSKDYSNIHASSSNNSNKTHKKKKMKSVPDIIKSRRRKRHYIKAKRIRKLIKSNDHQPSVSLQTNPNAEFFFDAILPHLDMKTFELLVDYMIYFQEPAKYLEFLSAKERSKHNSNDKDNPHETHTPIYRLNILFSSSDIIHQNPWMKPLISHFLLGKAFLTSSQTVDDNHPHDDDDANDDFPSNHIIQGNTAHNTLLDMVKADETFIPQQNRLHFDEHVQILIKAREKAVQHPKKLKWTATVRSSKPKRQKGKDSKRTTKTTITSGDIHMELINQHHTKSETTLRKEAEDMASLLADRLPQSSHEKLYDMLRSFSADDKDTNTIGTSHEDTDTSLSSSSEIETTKPKSKKSILKNLFPRVKQKVQSHTILVIKDLATFLYVPIPVNNDYDTHDSSNNNENDPNMPNHLSNNAQLLKLKKKWDEIRAKVVKLLILAQHEFAFYNKEEEINEIAKNSINDDVKSRSTHLKTKKKKNDTRRVHLVFDAMAWNDQDSDMKKTQEKASPSSLTLTGEVNKEKEEEYINSKRGVFLTNLPIDVTLEEIQSCYERCGPISHVKLFNTRPDLDPGQRSKKDMIQITKRQRLNVKPASNRTPVYAFMEFTTDEGYFMATNVHLTIFGMVIRRHTVQSIAASNMNKVFLENIPSGFNSFDLEYKFNKVLQPHVYVCLDKVNGKRGTGHDYIESKSCEIHFPSFEAAMFAYERLQMIDILMQTHNESTVEKYSEEKTNEQGDSDNDDDKEKEPCVLHWIKTPSNAMEFWKREIHLD